MFLKIYLLGLVLCGLVSILVLKDKRYLNYERKLFKTAYDEWKLTYPEIAERRSLEEVFSWSINIRIIFRSLLSWLGLLKILLLYLIAICGNKSK